MDLSRPLSLAEVIRLAEAGNLGLKQRLLTIDSAEGSLKSSRSQLFPSLRSSLGYTRSVANFTSPRIDPDSGLLLEQNVTNVTVESSLRLSTGMSLVDPSSWQSVKASSSSLDATKADVERGRQSLAYTMTQQYFELVRAKQLTEVSEQAYQLSQEQLQRAQALYDLGSVARSDVLQAQVNLASADRDRISAITGVEQQKARLAVGIGAPVDAPIDVQELDELTGSPSSYDEPSLINEAMDTRPDIRAAELGLSAAEHSLSASKWNRWPTLNASASWSKRGGSPDDVLNKFDRDISYGAGLSLDWTMFDGLNTKGTIERSQAEVATRRRALEEAELQAALEVREARLGIQNATESIRSAEEGVRLAEESAKLQQALYESGGGTLLEWNNAQVELTRARVSLVQAQVDLRLALAQMDLAVGRIGSR
ncbi:MAG: TolC family protein [Candidatus Eisenbacteria bacterium]